MNVKTISTKPFNDQRPGTSGLRKKTAVFKQPNYLENFVQSIFDVLKEDVGDFSNQTIVVGGDGRFYNREAIQRIVQMAVANGFARVWVGRSGIMSTPAMSVVIRRYKTLGGIILSASHNPGGPDGDFGVKFNGAHGGPAAGSMTEKIYRKACVIEQYLSAELPKIDIEQTQKIKKGSTEIEVIDPLRDYADLMEEIFDFQAIQALFKSGFRMSFDAMNAVTGPYAKFLFEEKLGAPKGTVMRGVPLEDFGGAHPDPNLIYAEELVAKMMKDDAPDFGAASDGDGDRNMILGKKAFVSPGDSLAMIAEHIQDAVPYYKNTFHGIARSMPTSRAIDRVAESLGLQCYETPTGWKFFGNLMDANLCTLCGEESFGTSSSHVREKDGLWAVLCWLSILSKTRKSVQQIMDDHWKKFGRSYFQRYDFEGLEIEKASEMMQALKENLSELQKESWEGVGVKGASEFSYKDPVDQSETRAQGIQIFFEEGSRVVFRFSGTGTSGATLRMYVERYEKEKLNEEPNQVLASLAERALNWIQLKQYCGRDKADIVT